MLNYEKRRQAAENEIIYQYIIVSNRMRAKQQRVISGAMTSNTFCHLLINKISSDWSNTNKFDGESRLC